MDLGNYKIKVTTEAEIKEAQELFYQLGFTWGGVFGQCVKTLKFPCVVFNSHKFLQVDYAEGSKDIGSYQELTLPQLRDLVVLHRNDVSDANYIKNDGEMFSYLSSDNIEYTWNFVKNNWFKSSIYFSDSGIKPINQNLISGADALRALADGEDVEYFSNADYTWKSIFKYHPSLKIIANKELDINHKFRLKPRTITLNIEIPAPFEPTEGEEFYVLSSIQPSGYIKTHLRKQAFLGAWKSEHDIQQVVTALRGALKNG